VTGARSRLLSDLARHEGELSRLTGDHVSLIQASQSSNADDEHDPEGATIAFEREQLVSIMSHVRQAIDDLRKALIDLDDGRYGVCSSCAEPIEPERLEVRPQARMCVTCAKLKR
jgi:DnaK suppressor protein